MSRILAAVASVVLSTAALGETITIETLGWTGSGATNGWRYVSLGTPFPDGAARFATGSRIVSPRWRDFDILGIDVKLRCSTNEPSRWLQVSFLRDRQVVTGPMRFDGVFAADKSETQSVPASRDLHANGFALSVSDGDIGNWGVYAVGVTVAKTTRRIRGFAVSVW